MIRPSYAVILISTMTPGDKEDGILAEFMEI